MKRPESKNLQKNTCFFQAQNRKKRQKKGEISFCPINLLKSHVFFLGGGVLSGCFNFYPITLKPSGECRLDFSENSWRKKNCPPKQFFYSSRKKVRSHQRKAIKQGSKFLFGMCSSHQDCYLHQFSDDYVDVRYQLYIWSTTVWGAMATIYIRHTVLMNIEHDIIKRK